MELNFIESNVLFFSRLRPQLVKLTQMATATLACALRAKIAWLINLQAEHAPCFRPAPAQRLLKRALADRQDWVAVGKEAQERGGSLAVLTAVFCILDAQSKPADSWCVLQSRDQKRR